MSEGEMSGSRSLNHTASLTDRRQQAFRRWRRRFVEVVADAARLTMLIPNP